MTIVKKSKVRLLTKTLAVATLLAPAAAHSLGIGEIQLHSALNQKLDAEISLTLSGENVSDIKVRLAPPEKFDEAGVPWTSFLSKIKFETVRQNNKAAVIKLSSKDALTEPFLDFLLEVTWPKGSLFREFTVLVDPPAAYKQPTMPVITQPDTYTQTATATATPHANGNRSANEYGPTQPNDTLWSVADRVRSGNDVSVEQMMMALYQANPGAFYKGNVYALMAGETLKIPARESVLKLSRSQALAEFNRHTKAWKSHAAADRAFSAKPSHARSKTGTVSDNQLKLVAPAKASIEEHVGEAPAPAVQTGKSGTKTYDADAVQNRIAALEKQLAMLQEMVALKDQQLAALQNRSNSDVEVETTSAESASSEQSQQESAVQAQPTPAGTDQTVPAEQAVSSEQSTQTEQAAPQPGQIAAKAQTEVQPAQATTEEAAKAKSTTPEQAKPVQSKPAEKPKKPKTVITPEPKSDSGFSLYDMFLAGFGILAIASISLMWWRKRKTEEETSAESMFATAPVAEAVETEENVSVPIVEDIVSSDSGVAGESSFLSEFTPSDFDSFDTDQGEIDPISEADVYLAYGRYKQAEELIRQAILDQPDRDECKLKLLEVFYANESKEDFEAYAEELVNLGKRTDVEFWEKAAEMGREICPDSPLFSGGEELFAVDDANASENAYENVVAGDDARIEPVMGEDEPSVASELLKKEPEIGDTELDLPALDSEIDESADGGTEESEQDFDLSSFSMDMNEDSAQADAISLSKDEDKANEDIEEIAFDLGSFASANNDSDSGQDEAVAVKPSDIEEIEFDLGSFEKDDEQKVVSAAATPASDIEEIEFNLGSFTKDVDDLGSGSDGAFSVAEGGGESASDIEEIEFDLGSFDKDTSDSERQESAQVSSSGEKTAGDIEEIEFDLGAFSSGDESKLPDEQSDMVSGDSAGDGADDLDFDLDAFASGDVGTDELTQDESSTSVAGSLMDDFDVDSFATGDVEIDETKSEQTSVSSGSLLDDFDLELGIPSARGDILDELNSEQADSSQSAPSLLDELEDFDNDAFSADQKASDTQDASQSGNTPSLLDELGFDQGADLNEAGSTDSDNPFDDTTSSSSLSPDKAEGGLQQAFGDFDFNFDTDGLETKQSDDSNFSADGEAIEIGDDLDGDFDFNLDFDLPSDGSDKDVEGVFGVSDLTDMDEMETKLDLAKAYVDMGDAEAAKDIAKEVLEQGTPEQQKIAQALLDELG